MAVPQQEEANIATTQPAKEERDDIDPRLLGEEGEPISAVPVDWEETERFERAKIAYLKATAWIMTS